MLAKTLIALSSFLLSWLLFVRAAMLAAQVATNFGSRWLIVPVMALAIPVEMVIIGWHEFPWLVRMNPPGFLLRGYFQASLYPALATALPMLLVYRPGEHARLQRWGVRSATAWAFLPLVYLLLLIVVAALQYMNL